MIAMVEVDTKNCVEHGFGYCTVCGSSSLFLSWEPVDMPCKRNGFACQTCGAVGRNRHVAWAVLEQFRDTLSCSSLREFGQKFAGNIWIGCVKEAVSRALPDGSSVVKSEFMDGLPSGVVKDGVLCQDVQATSFPSDHFDLIISEDVLEHVPDPAKAFAEIRRVLKPGGKHIFTIPVDWTASSSLQRAIVTKEGVHHLMEPEIHGDPFRPEGILAFYTFGNDVVERFCGITGATDVHAAHGYRLFEDAFRIYNSWVFISTK